MRTRKVSYTTTFVLISTLGALVSCVSENAFPEAQRDGGPADAATSTAPSVRWYLPISTAQLVTEAVDPVTCPSGWTTLKERYEAVNQGRRVPLQPDYVQRFPRLPDLANAVNAATPLFKDAFPRVRLSVMWPCFVASAQWRADLVAAIRQIRAANLHVEIVLLQHDSYPLALDQHPQPVYKGGWAHPDAPQLYAEYVQQVLAVVGTALLHGAHIHLAYDYNFDLFEAYLGGAAPPGGTQSGVSLALALINLRQALKQAALAVREAGFVPVLSPNIKPFQIPRMDQEAQHLDYVYNWWLPDALIQGCVDDDFNGECERVEEAGQVSVVGLVFYGAMTIDSPAEHSTVMFGLPGQAQFSLPKPHSDARPNAALFKTVLQAMRGRYPGAEIGVAEIGFSDPLDEQINHLKNYLRTLLDWNGNSQSLFLGLNGLFQSAQFSSGVSRFHLLNNDCGDLGDCTLTDWGAAAMAIALGMNSL